MANEFRVTGRGDVSDVVTAIDQVGSSSRGMADDVDRASDSAGRSLDGVGEGADTVASKGSQAAGALSGLGDLVGGKFGGAMVIGGTAMQGFADAGDLVNVAMEGGGKLIGKAGDAVKAFGEKTKITAAATKIWAGIQKVFNIVMGLNPILLVVLAIVALVAILVIAYKKSDTFRRIVDGAFRAVKKVAENVADFFRKNIPAAFDKIKDAAGNVLGWVRDHWKTILAVLTGPIGIAVLVISKNWGRIKDGAKRLVDGIKNVFRGVGEILTAPFRAAFAAIKSLWNSTIGGFGFTVPGWIPEIGGQSFTIPSMHTGGVMPGTPGTAGLALLMAGERVTPVGGRGGGATVIEIRSSGSKVDDMLVELLRGAIRVKGGNVQLVLGR